MAAVCPLVSAWYRRELTLMVTLIVGERSESREE